MMHYFVTIALVMVVATLGAGQHAVADRGQWQPQSGDDSAAPDRRLTQRVEIEIIGRAAVPALQVLTEATGVSLQVAPEDLDTVGERKLTIISNGLDLKSIMVQIPWALQECHWDIEESGEEPVYLLHRNAGVEPSIERDGVERRQEMEARLQQRRRECVEEVRSALAMSPDELAELEKTDIFLARAAQHPLTRELMEKYVALPDEHLAELVETGYLELPYNEAPAVLHEAVSCSFKLRRRYFEWVESRPADERSPYGDEIGDWRQQTAQLEERLAANAGSGIAIHVRNLGGREVGWGTTLSVTADGETVGGAMLIPARYMRSIWPGNEYEWLLVATGDSVKDARETIARSRQAWSKLRDERQWSERGWVEPGDARLHARVPLPWSSYGDEQYVALTDLQQRLAEETGLSVISDYFTSDWLSPYPGQAALGDALWRDLYILGQSANFEWRLVGDCLVFHRTMWHRLAQRELPESLIVKYRDRLQCQGRFTLDDVIEFAVELEGHASAGQRFGPSLPMDLIEAGVVHKEGRRGALLLYNSLSPEERAKARGPEGLTFAALRAKGRTDLVDYLPLGGRASGAVEQSPEEIGRGVTFFITESAGEAVDGPFVEYEFRFVCAKETSLPENCWTTTVHLPKGPPVRAGETGGSGS